MSVLVVYDTRHGFTEKCVRLLGQAMEGSQLEIRAHEVGSLDPDWHRQPWDAVLLGGPVYYGRFRSRLLSFVRRHRDYLVTAPNFSVFVVSLSPRLAAEGYLRSSLVPALGFVPRQSWFFGGGVSWSRLNRWERWQLKQFRGIENDVSNLALSEIQQLAVQLGKL